MGELVYEYLLFSRTQSKKKGRKNLLNKSKLYISKYVVVENHNKEYPSEKRIFFLRVETYSIEKHN